MSRFVNLFIALLLVLPISLLIVLVGLIVIAVDRSSPIFVQVRVGRHEKPFKLFKIRTMDCRTAEAATHLVSGSSVTKTGRILRKFKIDELPQIFNVLNGSMNFVGPRPGLASQLELTAARKKYGVFEAVPGITGFAQINNYDMSKPELLARVDAEYIETRNLTTDLQIIVKTLIGNGRGDKVVLSKAPSDVLEVSGVEPNSDV